MKRCGFYMCCCGVDYFYESNAKYITDYIAMDMLEMIRDYQKRFFHIGKAEIANAKKRIQKASCRFVDADRPYYDIYGKGFGGRGSFVDDGKTVLKLAVVI